MTTTFRPSPRALALFALLSVSAPVLAACGGSVVVDEPNGDQVGSHGDNATARCQGDLPLVRGTCDDDVPPSPPEPQPEPTPDPAPAANAISMFYAQLPEVGGGDFGSSSSGGASGIAPDTLYVMIGSQPRTCGDPWGSAPGCEPYWQVTIGIPPELAQVGTIALSDPQILSTASVQGSGDEPNQCWGGGGSFVEGTLEIVSMDASSVVVTLAGTSSFDFSADGTYTALRCP